MNFKLYNFSLLFKASYFNAVIVLVKVICGLIVSKAVAIFMGPAGLALLGNLKSFTETAISFTSVGYQNGTIRYISEYSKDVNQRNRITATVLQLSFCCSLLIGVLLWGFSNYWSLVLFKSTEYTYVPKILAFGLPFLSFNLISIYILNGLEKFKKLVIVNSVLNITQMLFVVCLVINYNLKGGLIGTIIGPIFVFLFNLMALGNDRTLLLNLFKTSFFSKKVVENISVYFFMAIYSSAIVSINLLLIRNLIIEKLNVLEAGYWEAMNRISSFYIMFFISLTSFYLLPRLSKINDFKVFKEELKSFYTLCVPLLIIVFVTIYFLRFFLLKLLLNDEFLPTSNLFFWKLIGDFISVLAIALVKQFHAKRMVKAYIICNGLLNLLYFSLSYYFIDIFGLEGVVKAYAVSYSIYLVLVICFILNYHKKQSA